MIKLYTGNAVAAGLLIGLACALNLKIGGLIGALFFSLGLLGVCVL